MFATWAAWPACTQSSRPVVVQPDDPVIRYTGAFDRRVPKAPRFAWPGTQITMEFTGTSLRVRLTDMPNEDDTRETDWITVLIDERPPKTYAVLEGLHAYPVAQGLGGGEHRVVIWKRTEADVGTITFHGFDLDPGASASKPPARSRSLLLVGDSITAGYGNEGPDASCHWSAARENSYETYGAYAARALGADCVVAAASGKGLTRNYEKRDLVTLPEIHDRVIPTEKDSPRIPGERHDVHDVVVVNVGTNDFFQGTPDETKLLSAYRRLIAALRGRHPNALVILGLGPMLADDYPQLGARTLMRNCMTTVRDERSEAGDEQIVLLELWFDPAEGVGCDFHPNVRTHARFGRELADAVREKLGW